MRTCGHGRTWTASLLLGALLLPLSSVWPAPASAAPSPVVLVPPGSKRAYTSEPGSHALLLVRHDGAILAAQHFDSDPTALALDRTRGLLYVALGDSPGILVLRSSSLAHVLTLHAVAAATRLVAVPGKNALYLFDPASKRLLHLTYTSSGAVRLVPVINPQRPRARRPRTTGPPTLGQLHVFLSAYSAHAGQQGTFWASGFHPGETVAVSWGAHNQGNIQADRYGIVGGSLPAVASAAPGLHSLGLYGLASHLSLTQIVRVGPTHRRGAGGRKASALARYLELLPGPRATLSPPLLRRTLRVPISAGVFPMIPVAGLLGWVKVRRRKRARRKLKAKVRRR